MPDLRVRQMKDQLIRARVYLGLSATRTNPHYIKELRLRIRDVQRALGEATKDSDLPRKYVSQQIRLLFYVHIFFVCLAHIDNTPFIYLMPLMYRIFILELTLHQSQSPELKSRKAFTWYYEPPTVAISLYLCYSWLRYLVCLFRENWISCTPQGFEPVWILCIKFHSKQWWNWEIYNIVDLKWNIKWFE